MVRVPHRQASSARFALAPVAALAAVLVATPAGAQYAADGEDVEATYAPSVPPRREPSARDIVIAYNVGPRLSIAPGIIIPSDGGNVGFSLAGDFRYGFEAGPTVLAPGVRLAGYFPSGATALVGLATGRVTLPVGPLGPFVLAGAGPGYVSEPSATGLAYIGGGGLMIHIGRSFAFGAEATYQGITGTNFRALFVGPVLLLAF
jgi:hypothetical protein